MSVWPWDMGEGRGGGKGCRAMEGSWGSRELLPLPYHISTSGLILVSIHQTVTK